MTQLARMIGVVITLIALPGCASVSGVFSPEPALQVQDGGGNGRSASAAGTGLETSLDSTAPSAKPATLGDAVSANQLTQTPAYDLTFAAIDQAVPDIMPTEPDPVGTTAAAPGGAGRAPIATLPAFFSAMGESSAMRRAQTPRSHGLNPQHFDPQATADRIGRGMGQNGNRRVPAGPDMPDGDMNTPPTALAPSPTDRAPSPSAEALDLRLERFGSMVLDMGQVPQTELSQNGLAVPQVPQTPPTPSEAPLETRASRGPYPGDRPDFGVAALTGIPQLTLASADPPPPPDTRIIVAALPDIGSAASAEAEKARLAIAPLSRLSVLPDAARPIADAVGRILGGTPAWRLIE